MSDTSHLENTLCVRASNQCELCKGDDALTAHLVLPHTDDDDAEHHVLVCAICRSQIEVGGAELDSKHWFCLQEAIWSEVGAVQVVSWRLLKRLSAAEPWAQDLLDQAYLSDEVLAWAKEGVQPEVAGGQSRTVDSNGAELQEGDSVTLIKDLDVKGTSFVAKRGTLVKGIRLTDNPEHVEGKVNAVAIVLKTMFLKKA
ncbi:MAG: PhnA domain-containing protein [Bradymonadaceae bacterium]|nr:PhnA domain-containing protein [Lujinxingiaceae bacterium]